MRMKESYKEPLAIDFSRNPSVWSGDLLGVLDLHSERLRLEMLLAK